MLTELSMDNSQRSASTPKIAHMFNLIVLSVIYTCKNRRKGISSNFLETLLRIHDKFWLRILNLQNVKELSLPRE